MLFSLFGADNASALLVKDRKLATYINGDFRIMQNKSTSAHIKEVPMIYDIIL